jgi:hypothetical protein
LDEIGNEIHWFAPLPGSRQGVKRKAADPLQSGAKVGGWSKKTDGLCRERARRIRLALIITDLPPTSYSKQGGATDGKWGKRTTGRRYALILFVHIPEGHFDFMGVVLCIRHIQPLFSKRQITAHAAEICAL